MYIKKEIPTLIKTKVSTKANAIRLLVNIVLYISGFLATPKFIKPNIIPVAKAPKAIGIENIPNIRHLEALINNKKYYILI